MALNIPPASEWARIVDASFDLHRVGVLNSISPVVLDALRHNAEIHFWRDTADRLVVDLSAYVLGMEGKQVPCRTDQIFVPKSWWQHFKQDCFPAWARKWWPVKRTALPFVTVLREYRVCPHGTHRFDTSEAKAHFSWLKDGKP